MNKLIAAFMVVFFLLSLLSGVMDGSASALASTNLTAAIDDEETTLNVTSTIGFLSVDGVLFIDDEKLTYAGVTANTFTGVVRGVEDTDAANHANSTAVYHEDAGVLNHALGFEIIDAQVEGGSVNVLTAGWNFTTITVPKIVTWNYAFFEGDLVIVRYVLMSMSIGIIIYISFMAINTVFGTLQRAV